MGVLLTRSYVFPCKIMVQDKLRVFLLFYKRSKENNTTLCSSFLYLMVNYRRNRIFRKQGIFPSFVGNIFGRDGKGVGDPRVLSLQSLLVFSLFQELDFFFLFDNVLFEDFFQLLEFFQTDALRHSDEKPRVVQHKLLKPVTVNRRELRQDKMSSSVRFTVSSQGTCIRSSEESSLLHTHDASLIYC